MSARRLVVVAMLVGVFFSIIVTPGGMSATIIVDDDEGSWAVFTSIQDAINAAIDGDEIYVYNGTYEERLNIQISVDIFGNGSSDTLIDGGGVGDVVLIDSDGVIFKNFTVTGSGTTNAGIRVEADTLGGSNQVIGNVVTGSHHGIHSYNSLENSIKNNICMDNSGSGIYMDYSNDNFVKNNTCINNTVGIHLYHSSRADIRNCTVSDNTNQGIYLEESCYDNTIRYCDLIGNEYYGVLILPTCNDTTIHHNNFTDNDDQHPQGSDSGSDNRWHNGSAGNSWSDYNGTDGDSNGIGDTPYELDGDANKTDPYPIMAQPEPKNLVPTGMIGSISPSPAYETFNATFEGNGTDEDGTVVRYVWSSSIDGEFYDGSENSTTTDVLSFGNHTISLRCQDDDDAWSEWVTEELEVRSAPSGENIAPNATIVSISPNPAVYGQTITFNASAVDVDGTIASYIWTSNLVGNELYNGANQEFMRSDLRTGTHTITLIVTDDQGEWSESVTATLEVNAEAEPPGEDGSDEEKGITDQIIDFFTSLPENPLMLGLVLGSIFAVIGAVAAVGSRRKKRRAEEEAKVAEEARRQRGPPPDERQYRPPPEWRPREGERRGPPRDENHRGYDPPRDRLPGHAPPPEDADIEWRAEPVGGPPRGDHAEHFYDRESYGRPKERMDRREGEWDARGYERGHGPMGRPQSPYERPTGPEHDMYARPPPRREEPEEEEEDDDFIYDRGGQEYRAMTAPVKVPEKDLGRRCSQCGAPLDEGERFCVKCGTYLS